MRAEACLPRNWHPDDLTEEQEKLVALDLAMKLYKAKKADSDD